MSRLVHAALGAGLVMAFVTVARTLRESLYLNTFPVDTLPYVTVAAALLALPGVGLYSRRLARGRTRSPLAAVAGGLAVAIGVLWPLLPDHRAAVVALYLVTATGTLLLASGYWVALADLFPVRDAKRQYGLVAAGGTAGTLVAGLSARWLGSASTLLTLVALLGVFVVVLWRLPAAQPAPAEPPPRFPVGSALREIGRTPHLRGIAALIFAATVASTLVDFQFKAAAQARTDPADLPGFLGTFYGLTGVVALLLQLLVAPRLLSERGGVAGSLAVLPSCLVVGAAAQFVVPGVAAATLLRGADNALRRAVHRPVLEYLFVPLPRAVRRRTKTVLDTVVDSAAEATGALVVLLLVTLGDWPVRSLSGLVIAAAAILWLVGRRMAAEYARTVVAQLQAAPTRDIYTASFTRLDLGLALADDEPPPSSPPRPATTVLERLQSPDNDIAAAALADLDPADPAQLAAVVRQLARDPIRDSAATVLAGLGEGAVPALVAALRDRTTSFAVRRRLPALLARAGSADADDALLDALTADRFEVRYRAAAALARRRRSGLPTSTRDWPALVWAALAVEVSHDRPIWELQRLLDAPDDELAQRVGVRGGLSLEHAFRLLGLVVDPAAAAAAHAGVLGDDPQMRSLALEYLEQVLPPPVRERLWGFIGDGADRGGRPLDVVLQDLLNSHPGEDARREVRRILDSH